MSASAKPIYELPAMWRSTTGEDLFASEPGIRGFLDFLVYRTRPDGTHFRWGDGGYLDKIVPDAIPLALELRHAAAYSLRLIGLPFGTALGFLYSVTTVSGPPLAIFFDNQGLVKKEFRAGLGGFAWLSQA